MGHEWRVHAAYLTARFDVVDAAVAAIGRLARRSALPLAQWHLHRLQAARTLLGGDRNQADPLTSREREVAALLAQAMSNRQIAARLVLSERTVESHVRSILAKTQCAKRTEFVAKWNPSWSP